mmetsp:Transcript_15157/g.27663  ORF Transcript_15157/g.27663 Transcript_15157/m.27663 type:complete len:136 (-) Transcript_15157:346-753(-)
MLAATAMCLPLCCYTSRRGSFAGCSTWDVWKTCCQEKARATGRCTFAKCRARTSLQAKVPGEPPRGQSVASLDQGQAPTCMVLEGQEGRDLLSALVSLQCSGAYKRNWLAKTSHGRIFFCKDIGVVPLQGACALS